VPLFMNRTEEPPRTGAPRPRVEARGAGRAAGPPPPTTHHVPRFEPEYVQSGARSPKTKTDTDLCFFAQVVVSSPHSISTVFPIIATMVRDGGWCVW
jgi:hypothetical protein